MIFIKLKKITLTLLIVLIILFYFAGLLFHARFKNSHDINPTKNITYKDLTNNKYINQTYNLKNVYVNQQFTKDNTKQATVSDNHNQLYFIILNHNRLPNGTTSLFCKIEKYKILKTNLGYKYRYPVLKLINKKSAD